MRALSIRHPWAELILRGHKTIECRSRPTRIQERGFIYAARGSAHAAPLGPPIDAAKPLRGVRIGSVEITGCRLLAIPCRPTRHPQPVFVYPFEQILR